MTSEINTNSEERVPLSAWFSLLILTIILLFAMVDRVILSLMAEPVKQTMGLSDLQLGLMQGTGIAIFAALAAYPIGWLADRFGRRIVLAGSILVWSAAVVGCALAQNFEQLFIATSMVGAGEAGLAPITFAMIPQLFGKKKRQLANSIFILAAAASGGLGMVLAGQLVSIMESVRDILPMALQQLEGWRLSFLAAAAPAPLMILLVATIRIAHAHKPAVLEDDAAVESGSDSTLLQHFTEHRKTMFTFFSGMGFALFSFGAVGLWLPVILMRQFGQTPAQVGAALGSLSLVGLAAGFLFVVFGLRLLEARLGSLLQIRVMWTAALLCVFTSLMFAFVTSAQQIYVLQGVQIVCLTAANMLYPTVLQNLSPDHLRTRVIAIQTAVNVGFAAAAGPLVGYLSDVLSDNPRGLIMSASAVACCGLAISTSLFRWCEHGYVKTIEAIERSDSLASETAEMQPA